MDPPAGTKGVRQSVGSVGGDPETLRIKLLGDFSVSVGSRTIQRDAWRLRKAVALVKLLALAPRHRLHREQVMDALWPDSGKRAASNSLRKTLYAARRALDPAGGSRPPPLARAEGGLSLDHRSSGTVASSRSERQLQQRRGQRSARR